MPAPSTMAVLPVPSTVAKNVQLTIPEKMKTV